MLFSSLVLVPILSTVELATERFLSLFFFFCLDKRNLHVELIVLTWKQDKMEDLKKQKQKKNLPPLPPKKARSCLLVL